jgi:hypothetical protein
MFNADGGRPCQHRLKVDRRMAGQGLAPRVAMLGQSSDAPGDMLVRDLVTLGRYAHRRVLAGPSAQDHHACRRAIHAANIETFADTLPDTLSGGQRQRAWIGMVVAQEAEIILLDEATNHLDIAHALEVLELLRDLNRNRGRSVIAVLRDLNLAALRRPYRPVRRGPEQGTRHTGRDPVPCALVRCVRHRPSGCRPAAAGHPLNHTVPSQQYKRYGSIARPGSSLCKLGIPPVFQQFLARNIVS